jgi:site-specific DNA-cytosine methylase
VKALCLFGGLGATAKGASDIGLNVVGIVENNPTAAETLRLNFRDEQVFQLDVKTLDFAGTFGTVDLLEGGPPCQPFSQAADNTGEYDPRDCIPDFLRAIKETTPRVFIMEEVPTLTWAKHRTYLDRVLTDMRDLGYDVEWRVLDMSKYGLAQKRKRLFVVGVQVGQGGVVWPEQTPGQTMGEALGWTPEVAEGRARMAPVYGDPSWVFERPSTTVVGSFRPEVQAAPGYRRAGDGPRQNTAGSVVITKGEALTLQGMPADWLMAGSEAKQRLQIGNSCPATMTAQIAAANLRLNDERIAA